MEINIEIIDGTEELISIFNKLYNPNNRTNTLLSVIS